MPVLTLNMTVDNAVRADAALRGFFAMLQIPDPGFGGNPEDAPLVDQYTSIEWAEIQLKRHLAQITNRWENKVAKDAARVPFDPNIAT